MNNGQRNKNDAFRLVITQTFWVASLFPIFRIWDQSLAISMTVGGMAALLPNLFFYRCMFTYHGAQAARRILNGFYFGEFGKVVMTIILLSIAYHLPGILPASVLLGFVVTQLFFWFTPFVVMFIYPRIKLLVS